MSASLVRNLMGGPTVLTPDPSSQEFIRWEGAGDPEGGDVQLVSETAAASVPFARAVARQILSVESEASSTPEAVAAHLAHQHNAAQAARATAEAAVAEVVVREADKDLLGVPCVGPDTRGTGACGELVSVPHTDRNIRPPLCTRHKPLAAQFVPEDAVEGEKTTTRWTRVVLGDREKAPGA